MQMLTVETSVYSGGYSVSVYYPDGKKEVVHDKDKREIVNSLLGKGFKASPGEIAKFIAKKADAVLVMTTN